ncbi:sporulation initiation factor Spo0A C-terminal domain-containing protein [Lacrimispora sp.]|uniref:sporulation initiation factor Spo0A C-terminal domain-containing protein n=1 Tax=Lacrimispora sp. TaxID=2719234 RepID=UPI0028AC3D8B|nr:sporulation initiation factor Spo0A C-terminal domain-containing protein [Lacrimispora sp.]
MENQSAFINEVEKEIVLWRKCGYSFYAIAGKYGITEEQAKRKYSSVLRKMNEHSRNLIYKSCEADIFPTGTISEFLDYLGVTEKVAGRYELAEAIKFSYEYPETLDEICERFFPELSLRLGIPVVSVEGRVRRILRRVFNNRNNKGTPASVFFNLACLQNRHDIRLKSFFLTALECVRELNDT